MYIHKVIPLVYLPRSQSQILSYFSSRELPWGALVSIPLAKKTASGIVISSKPIESKISIKKADFALKSLKDVINKGPVLTPNQFSLVEWLAEYYYSPLSALLKLALPNVAFLKKTASLNHPLLNAKETNRENIYVFHDDFNFLKKKIKEILQDGRQVFMLFPNQIKLETYKQQLSEFSEDTIVFNKQKSIKALDRKKIIMGLRSSIFAPFSNLGLIVVVDEENPSHETWETKIHFSSRQASFKLAELFFSQLIFVSQNPSVESWPLIQKGWFKSYDKLPELPHFKIAVTDLRKTASETIIAPAVLEDLKKIINQKGRVLVVVNRRGLAPALICEDCGYVLRCPNCEAAMVYHFIPPIIELRCHHCGFKTAPADVCPNCQSHLIKFLGVATQKTVNFLQKQFPAVVTQKFDSDNLKNIKEEKELFGQFENGKTQILVATELFFKFLDRLTSEVDLSILASAEQILVFPDFRSEERLKRIIQKLSSVSKKVAVQTFNPEKKFFQNINNLDKFYANELELRSRLFYPPYSEIIKITVSSRNPQQLNRLSQHSYQYLNQQAAKLLNPQDYKILAPAPAFIPKIKNQYLREIFLRIKREPNELTSSDLIKKRNKILQFLPDDVLIKINPVNLL
jgi:primosomal protein N' (replication factor Y)